MAKTKRCMLCNELDMAMNFFKHKKTVVTIADDSRGMVCSACVQHGIMKLLAKRKEEEDAVATPKRKYTRRQTPAVEANVTT